MKIQILIPLALFLFSSNVLYSQQKLVDFRKDYKDSLLNISIQSALQSSNYDLLVSLSDSLRSFKPKSKEEAGKYMFFQNKMANSLIRRQKYELGEQIIIKSQRHFASFADTLSVEYLYSYKLLATSKFFQHNYKGVIPILLDQRKLIEAYGEKDLVNENTSDLTKFYFASGDLENGTKYFKILKEGSDSSKTQKYIYEAYLDLGNRLNFYEPPLGVDVVEFADYYYSKHIGDEYLKGSYFYLALGMLYLGVDLNGDNNLFEKSLKTFQKGFHIFKTNKDQNIEFEAYFNYYIGYCHEMLTHYDSALTYYHYTKNFIVDKININHVLYGPVMNNIGSTFFKTHVIDSALLYFNKANDHFVRTYGNKEAYHTLDNLRFIASIYLHQKNYAKSMETIQTILNALSSSNDTLSNINSLPLIDLLNDDELITYRNTIEIKCDLLQEMQMPDSLIIESYRNLFYSYFKTSHKQTTEKSSLIDIGSLKLKGSPILELILKDSSLGTRDKVAIWELITNLKSYSLRSIKNKVHAESDTKDLFASIVETKNQINSYQGNIQSDDYEQLYMKLIDLKIDYFLKTFNKYSESDTIANNLVTNYTNIKSQIESDEAVFDFLFYKNTLFSFVITNNNFEVFTANVPNDLDIQIRDIKRDLKTGTPLNNSKLLKISRLLFGKCEHILNSVNHLILIPDGILWEIPFEILPRANGDGLIIQRNSISYVYSSSQIKEDDTKILSNSILIVAPGFKANKNSDFATTETERGVLNFKEVINGEKILPPIPFTIEEGKAIESLFKKSKNACLALYENKASKEAFVSNFNRFDIIHIATHGVSDNENYWQSGLFFTKTNKDNIKTNGFLMLGELYMEETNAKLVVLSACKSGNGQLLSGEGIMALPRGFIASGVPNVIASLWSVNDERTKDLMVAFYKHLLEDKVNYTEALRLAKLDCIKKGFLPIDWAGFVFIGS